MSVQKYHPFENGKLNKEPKPYTQILNRVLQTCTDIQVLAVWCFLQSLPEEWTLSVPHLSKHFDLNKETMYKILSRLICANLLRKEMIRDAQGAFAQCAYTVLNGENFVNNQVAHPVTEKPYTAEPYTEKPSHINKTKNTNTTKSINTNLCASDDARSRFYDFWFVYPRKKDKNRAQKIWIKKNLDHIADKLIEDVLNRTKNEAQWRTQSFIPHPSTYLNNERWTDECDAQQPKTRKNLSPGAAAGVRFLSEAMGTKERLQ